MKTMTCIMCPMGCQLQVEEKDGTVVVSGFTCKRGETYGRQEFISPKRIVTTLVSLEGGQVVPVKTSDLIPKDKIFELLQTVCGLRVRRPVHVGDVLVPDVLHLGVDLVATKEVL